MSIEFKIPKDPAVMGALARYLILEAQKMQGIDKTPEQCADDQKIAGTAPTTHVKRHPEGHTFVECDAEGKDIAPAKTAEDVSLANAAEVFGNDTTTGVVGTIDPDNAKIVNVSGTATATEAPPATEGTVDVDGDGRPWDARIHSSGRTLNKKAGHWNYKRGVTDEVKAQVEAELDLVTATPADPAVTDDTPFVAPPPPAGEASEAVVTEMVVGETPVAKPVDEITFITIAAQIGLLGKAGKLTPTTLNDLVSPYGAAQFGDISQDQFKPFYPAIAATLDGLLTA